MWKVSAARATSNLYTPLPGEYIVSALDPAARNVEENYGLIIRYLPEGSTTRSRTYSIRNKGSTNGAVASSSDSSSGEGDAAAAPSLLAFKALRNDLVRDLDAPRGAGGGSEISMSSRKQVDLVVEQIRLACEDVGATSEEDKDFVKEEAIISLAEASHAVPWLDRLNYELKVSAESPLRFAVPVSLLMPPSAEFFRT